MPSKFNNMPYFIMLLTLTALQLIAIAFGGVAMGSINA
jgi:hypothetical protein